MLRISHFSYACYMPRTRRFLRFEDHSNIRRRAETLHVIDSFIYPTDAQLDSSIYVKINNRGAPTLFGFSQPPSGSYYLCFAKVISINNQLKYVVYRSVRSSVEHSAPPPHTHARARAHTHARTHAPAPAPARD